MTRVASKDRERLDAFIGQCLDPLPDETLVDTAYNSMARRQRWDAWRAARVKTYCYSALHEVADAMEHNRYPVVAPASIPPVEECLRLYREAVAEQLLTPCEDKADIEWKRRQIAGARFEYVPVTRKKVEASIAADEAFFAAHPTTRRPRRPRRGKAVQS